MSKQYTFNSTAYPLTNYMGMDVNEKGPDFRKAVSVCVRVIN
jgi:hypothetical protein